jgi:hypothetical protein
MRRAWPLFIPALLASVALVLSPSDARALPGWVTEGNQEDASYGVSVADAGDVNGDGFDDVIVGAEHFDNGQELEGRAFAYYGSATGIDTIADWVAESNQSGASFGFSVAGAGDVNGDGFDDVIVGAYLFGQNGEGRAFAYYGSAAGLSADPDWTVGSNQGGGWLGSSVSGAGDVNGDGFDDVIVGAVGFDNGQVDEGRAFAFHGSATGLSTSAAWKAEPNHVSAAFGTSVAGAGDVDRDGFDDVIVGAYADGGVGRGRAYAYRGSATGLSTIASWIAEGDRNFAHLGTSVSGAGDVNGDGFEDVIVGAPDFGHGQQYEGQALAYHGSATGLGPDPAWTVASNVESAHLGQSVDGAGDVNGDGFDDVVISAPTFPPRGAAFLVFGSPTGLLSTSERSESDQVGANYGVSVSGAGDVNGDGFDEVLIGASYYDHGQPDEGAAFLTYGHPD